MMSACYPELYVEGLMMSERFDEVDAFKAACKEKRSGPFLEYSAYVHGYLMPFLKYLKEEGIIRQGKCSHRTLIQAKGKGDVILNDEYYEYVGDVDSRGKACGSGVATKVGEPDFKYIGTFFNDLPEGIGKSRSWFNNGSRCRDIGRKMEIRG